MGFKHEFLAAALHCLLNHDQEHSNDHLTDIEHGIDQCCNDLLAEPDKWNSVQEMADSCHCSVDYFSKQFQARTGKNPSHYLTTVKMDRARSLLRYTTLSAQQVAESVGYADPGYFSRVFKKHHGQALEFGAKAQMLRIYKTMSPISACLAT